MVKVLKIDNINNYLVNETGDLAYIWDPNCKLYTKLEDGSILMVDSSQIRQQYGGTIFFDYENDKYIIDDGYQDALIRAGYIVLNEYSSKNIFDKEKGMEVRGKLFSYVGNVLLNNYTNQDNVCIEIKDNQEIKLTFEKSDYKFTVSIDTINNIVTKNQKRKLNTLPYYPYAKEMDKYGTLYLSIFAKKIDIFAEDRDKYKIAEDFMADLVNLLNKESTHDRYRIEKLLTKKKILNWKDL